MPAFDVIFQIIVGSRIKKKRLALILLFSACKYKVEILLTRSVYLYIYLPFLSLLHSMANCITHLPICLTHKPLQCICKSVHMWIYKCRCICMSYKHTHNINKYLVRLLFCNTFKHITRYSAFKNLFSCVMMWESGCMFIGLFFSWVCCCCM